MVQLFNEKKSPDAAVRDREKKRWGGRTQNLKSLGWKKRDTIVTKTSGEEGSE